MKIFTFLILAFSFSIMSYAQCGSVSTLAGSGTLGYANGTGTSAQFAYPEGIAVDNSGNVYVGDNTSHTIRKISPAGVVITLAGSGTQGYTDGTGTSAKFKYPSGVAVDGSGNVYVADRENNRIRKITPSGVVTTLAGSGIQGYADGVGTSAQFYFPSGVAVDGSGNVYVADGNNNRIRKISPAGVVTTLAGSSTQGYADGVGTSAQFSIATGIAVDGSGNVYVADVFNNKIRKISPTGVVTTLAGSGIEGYADGVDTTAQFYFPWGIAVDGSGNVYVGDWNNNRIRKITPSGVVTTLAGSGIQGYADGVGTSAQFNKPFGVAVDGSGNVYVADRDNLRIRKITFPLTTVSISYTGNPFCTSISTARTVSLSGTGTYTGGTYSSTTGLSINSTTGAIIPSTSTSGTYTVTYSTPATSSCVAVSATTQVTITALPTVTLSYSGSPFCKSLTSAQATTIGTGVYTGGTYTSTAGLSINSSTGVINPSLSTAGTYTVRYTIAASGGCAAVSTTTQIIITAIPNASISYLGSPFCKSLNILQSVTLTGTGAYTGGTYSSTVGLSISGITGKINPSLSTAGTYTVTYTTPASGGCAAVGTNTSVTITAVPTVTINYTGSPFCKSLTTAQVTQNGTGAYTGGSYSSPTGLSINSSTGEINPSLSTTGTHLVVYSIPASGGCAAVSYNCSVIVMPIPNVSISRDGIVSTSTTITNGSSVQLQLNGSLNVQPNLQWTPVTAISSATITNPVVYPSATTTYTASFINNTGCAQTTSFTVNVTPQPNIGNLSLSTSTTTVGLFDTITVNVQLNNAIDVYSLYMKLKGNAAVSQYLDYSGFTSGTLLGSNTISTPPTITNGVPDFGLTKVGAVPGYSGSGLFYTLQFKPKNISIESGTEFCFYLDDVSAYNSSGITCGLNNQGPICVTFTRQVEVWPGDLNKSNNVTTADLLPIGYFYNSTGSPRPNATIQWYAQPAVLWGFNHSLQNGDAYKVFADSNGDGIINNADQAAIGFNMNQVHNRMAWQAPDHFSAQAQHTLAVGSLTVTPNSTIINGAALPQTVTFMVNLNNTGGLNALYGMSVNLGFDNTVFDLSTATIDYTGSIFGNAGIDCLALNYNSDNTLSVGLTRFGNAPINGQGLLFKVTIQTKTTLPNLTLTPVTAYVDAANNQAGDTLVIQDAPATNFTIINNLGLDTIKQDEFVLYPNPASEVVFLQMGANTLLAGMKVKVVNLLGQVIEEQPILNNTTELSTKNWGAAGVYFVQIITSSKNVMNVKKIIKQ